MKRAEKSRKARFSLRKEHVLMSSDEDEPAPSPSATVLARRASRKVTRRCLLDVAPGPSAQTAREG